jgi:hypothetical protein
MSVPEHVFGPIIASTTTATAWSHGRRVDGGDLNMRMTVPEAPRTKGREEVLQRRSVVADDRQRW